MATGPKDLLALQNADGGWSYQRGGSWMEPTCYALLALAAGGLEDSPAAQRGAAWLRTCQRDDGGFVPRQSVRESTWITALPLLLPARLSNGFDHERAVHWVTSQSGRESGWVFRLRLFMMGAGQSESFDNDGWPWYPGAAAWVAPTAMSILALEKVDTSHVAPDVAKEIGRRLQEGRAYLLTRRCRDGGWNHGSTRALGYDSDSYPESTGMALLALHGTKSSEVQAGIVRAEIHLKTCQSSEAAQWLRLGLLAHGERPVAPALGNHGSTMENALLILADAAQDGRNALVNS